MDINTIVGVGSRGLYRISINGCFGSHFLFTLLSKLLSAKHVVANESTGASFFGEEVEMMMEIIGLSKSYGKKHYALQNINLTLTKGLCGLLGPNGAGKSTLMQILATLLTFDSGRITFGDLKWGVDDHEIRRLLGYLPQQFGLYQKLTGEEFLDYIAIMKGIKDRSERKRQVDQVLERVRLVDKRNSKIKTYSGGMKQRIGIAQALLGGPQFLVVDEPTVGLDPEERLRFRNMLAELSRDRVVLLSTHIVSDIENVCDRVAVMQKGKVLFEGAPNELTRLAERKVWTGAIDFEALAGVRPKGIIISERNTVNGYELRMLADEEPFSGAETSSPSMEDAYLLLTGGESRA
jgi:ABC-2 type transport system ATP-binding protein